MNSNNTRIELAEDDKTLFSRSRKEVLVVVEPVEVKIIAKHANAHTISDINFRIHLEKNVDGSKRVVKDY